MNNEKPCHRFEPIFHALLRISVGFIMAGHGWLKLNDLTGWTAQLKAMGIPYSEIAGYLSVAGEFLGGLGLVLGLLTPIAAFGVISVMMVAIVKVHWHNGLFLQNKGFEYPFIILMTALYFMVKGGGYLSIDSLFCRKSCKGEKSES